MRCYIIDDQEHAIINLSRQVLKTPGLTLVGSDTNALDAINKILSGVISTDIVFADIDMPDLDGLELARRIEDRAVVIFVTGHTDYAINAFELGAAGYIRKPINTEMFTRAVERAKELVAARSVSTPRKADSIFVKLNYNYKQHIFLKDLIWLQANNKYVILHIIGKTKALPLINTLSNFEAILPDTEFVRIHKSHIINLAHISRIEYNQVVMSDGNDLDIGPNYSKNLFDRLNMV